MRCESRERSRFAGRSGATRARAALLLFRRVSREPPSPGRRARPDQPRTPAGKEIAAGLLERGAHVVLACRNMSTCEAAAAELAAAHPKGSCECSR